MGDHKDSEDKQSRKAVLELYSFEGDFFEKHHITNTEQLPSFLEQKKKFWLNISCIYDENTMSEIAEIFHIHPLVLEDILQLNQRPKIEEFNEFIFLITKMVYSKNGVNHIQTEQLSILFGPNFVLSFQETPEDIFDEIRTRLENPNGKMRKMGPDYFAYTLLDTIVDQYYMVLELTSDTLEELEENIIENKKNISLRDIYLHRKNLQEVKRNIWPMREILSHWKKSENPLFHKKTSMFINDVYDHCIEIIENLEIQRESITSLVEVYMTQLSVKQNEVMKTLTIIATIFIPLTFIAGIYGMNFDYMPELNWKYSYFYLWGLFIVISVIMLAYFKKKDWF